MKKLAVLLALCLLLTGCADWMSGEYHSTTPHRVKNQPGDSSIPAISNLSQLQKELANIVESGVQEKLVSVQSYSAEQLDADMQQAISYIRSTHPIGAYAVDAISYELGSSGGVQAAAITVQYSRNPDELRSIKRALNMNEVEDNIGQALDQCDSGLVIRVRSYSELDFAQFVEDYMQEHPSFVMELPQVTVTTYPETGKDRVLDIRFVYQNSRETLRQMQRYVQPVFTSAGLYVSSEEESPAVKYARLYTFLMERNDYKQETSITPTYSLLRHGVGDSKAFAVVYARMCREAGLECLVVTGTHNSEARFWNIICEDGVYYHVDLLSPKGFVRYSDKQLAGYVWDYSAYPACGEQAAE